MSKFAQYKTELTDERLLIAALAATEQECEVHEQLATMHGYDGATQRAHIIVRKNNLKNMNQLGDLGFRRDQDGLTMVADDYTPELLDAWLGNIKQEYKIARRMEVAEQHGYVFMGREDISTEQGESNGVRLRFGVR